MKSSEQAKSWLSEIIGIENYFHQEINQRKSCSKKLSKYVTSFDYININKILTVLSATSSGVCITTGIIKKLLSIKRDKKKSHDKILMLAKSKLDSIETLVFQALIDMEVSMKNLLRLLGRNKNIRGWKKMWGMPVGQAPLKNMKMWDWNR